MLSMNLSKVVRHTADCKQTCVARCFNDDRVDQSSASDITEHARPAAASIHGQRGAWQADADGVHASRLVVLLDLTEALLFKPWAQQSCIQN